MSMRRSLPPAILTILLAVTACPPAGAARPPFGFGDSYDLSAQPRAFAVGDYDEDGRDDVIAVLAGGTIRQWHAAVDGTLETVSPPATSGPPRSIAVLDVNGDGYLDLAIGVDSSPPVIDVLLGNGNGTFTPGAPLATDTAVDLLRTGDLDADGDADLVGLSFSASLIRSWLDTGASFGSRVDWPGPSFAFSFAIGDLDSDGKGDLAIASYIVGQSMPILFLDGDGLGAFTQVNEFTFLGELGATRIGDLDQDGNNDVVVGSWRGPLVLWGDGTGGIDRVDTLSATRGTSEAQLVVTDVDEDGRLDIVACRSGGYLFDGWILVFPGDIGRHFDPAVEHEFYPSETPASYHGLEVGDFNGDGEADLVIGRGLSTSRQLITVFHRAGLLFEGVVEFSLGSGPIDSAAVARRGPNQAGQILFTGPFGVARVSPRPDGTIHGEDAIGISPYTPFHLADLDGDGDDDLAVEAFGGVEVGLQEADGSYGAFTHIASGRWLAFADVDGDADLDLVSEQPAGTVSVRRNNGSGAFISPMGGTSAIPTFGSRWVRGDWNQDGLEDLAVSRNIPANPTSNPDSITVLLSDGTGAFAVHSVVPIPTCFPNACGFGQSNTTFRDPKSLGAGDLDRDGDRDLVSVNYDDISGHYITYLNDGTGSFTPSFRVRAAIQEDTEDLVLEDFDADNILDVATTGMKDGAFVYDCALGAGDGQFSSVSGGSLALMYARSLASGDLDGDGMPELVGVSTETANVPNRLVVFYNATPGDVPTAVAVSLISASAELGRVRLAWSVIGNVSDAQIERRDDAGNWLTERVYAASDRISYVDNCVDAGRTYAYRLAVWEGDHATITPEVLLTVPQAARLALTSVEAKTSGGTIHVRFTAIPGSPVNAEVFDLGGRKVGDHHATVDATGNGELTVPVRGRAGVYWLRLSQDANRATGRFAIVR